MVCNYSVSYVVPFQLKVLVLVLGMVIMAALNFQLFRLNCEFESSGSRISVFLDFNLWDHIYSCICSGLEVCIIEHNVLMA